MVEYKCNRCGRKFKKKVNYEYHKKRKFPCMKKNIEKKFKCDGCNKLYSTKSNLNRHNKICNSLILADKNKDTNIFDIKKELDALKENINILMKKKNDITFNTQIIINNFGEESLDHINKEFILNLFNKPDKSVPKLIDAIHFNNDNNKNLYLSNKNNKIFIFNNGKWNIENKDKTVTKLVGTNFDRIDDFFEDYKNNLNKKNVNMYNKYANDFDKGINREEINKNAEEILEINS